MRFDDTDWHSLETSAVLETLHTGDQGLDTQESARRLELFGPNSLAEAQTKPRWKLFLEQFAGPLIAVLMVCGIITILLQH